MKQVNALRTLIASLLLGLFGLVAASAQSSVYLTEVTTATTGLKGEIETYLPTAFGIALVIFGATFLWRFMKRFVR